VSRVSRGRADVELCRSIVLVVPECRPTTTISIAIGDGSYVMSSDDDYLEGLGAEFEPSTVALLQVLVEDGDTVLDVGANIGCTTILFAQRAGRVYSFEPGRGTFKFLDQNVQASGHRNVVVENIALGSEEGDAELVWAPTGRFGATVSGFGVPVGHVAEQIAIIRGDSYVAEHGIERVDFIKIDTEGYEREVIEGLRATIDRDRPVVCLELNHWCLNAFRRMSVPDFLDYLRSVFPVLYAVDLNEVRDLYDKDDTYAVLYEHIVQRKFPAIVAAFDLATLDNFLDRYVRKSVRFRELEDRCLDLTRQNAALEAELTAMRGTTSWRITRPLRAVRRRVG
jgi:FkbM family methyltransferase